MGDAAFFALLCTQMVAPTMPLAGFMFALVTMGIGFFIGWGWGNAGWAAAHAVRNQAKAQAVMANIMSTWVLPTVVEIRADLLGLLPTSPQSRRVSG